MVFYCVLFDVSLGRADFAGVDLCGEPERAQGFLGRVLRPAHIDEHEALGVLAKARLKKEEEELKSHTTHTHRENNECHQRYKVSGAFSYHF